MIGIIKSIPIMPDSGKFRFYCFIESVEGKNGVKHFLHASDFKGHWFDDLCKVVKKNGSVKVQFEPVVGDKGPRASNCSVVNE